MATRTKKRGNRNPESDDAAPARTAGGLKGILTRVNPEGLKALRTLALERDTTLQALAVEAFNDVLQKHGRDAVVRNPLLSSRKPGGALAQS